MLSIVLMNKRSVLTAVLALGLGVTALTGCATDSDSAHSYVTPKESNPVRARDRYRSRALTCWRLIEVLHRASMNSRSARSGSMRWLSAPGQGTNCEDWWR